MAAIVSQLNSWFGGVLRYLQLAQAQTPLTASSALGWVCTTFAGGMSFTSLSFFLFFPICLLLYYVLPRKLRGFWLLVCSYWFYYLSTINGGSSHPEFLLLLAVVTLFSWVLCLIMSRVTTLFLRRIVLFFIIVSDLGLLCFYKYMQFFREILGSFIPALTPTPIVSTSVLLPLGISFYIFLSIGYAVDIYRNDAPAEKSLIRYALFVSFFPQIVSGPIARSRGLLHELHLKHSYNHKMVNEGLRQMLWGYFKKMILSNNAGAIVGVVFANPSKFNGFELLCGSLFFTLQIYADFSGYSDIAIGAAKTLGLRIGPNFNRPYFATSIGDFWDRWHISLSTWLRDYLYIPLGGSRKGEGRAILNVMIVFLLSGLWHGAAYTYLAWGALHGLYTVLSRITRKLRKNLCVLTRIDHLPLLHHFLQRLVTFSFVSFTWIFFRSASLTDAITFLRRLPLGLLPTLTDTAARVTSLTFIGFYKYHGPAVLCCTLVLVLVECICYRRPPEVLCGKLPVVLRMVLVYLIVLAILFFGMFGSSGLIYGAY